MKRILLFLCCIFNIHGYAQDSTQWQLPARYLSQVASRAEHLQGRLEKKSQKALRDFQKAEARIARKLARLDSAQAARFRTSSRQHHQQLQQKLSGTHEFSLYLPALDTLKTSLSFLAKNPTLQVEGNKNSTQLSSTLSKVTDLEGSLAKAESIKAFIRERRQVLKTQLSGMPFARELKKLHKQAYYYSGQVQEITGLLQDKKKLERKALELLTQSQPFQEFMRQNSLVASLFRMPGGESSSGLATLQGLQTRAQVSRLLQDRIALGGPNADAQVRENIQAAQAQLGELKNKLEKHKDVFSNRDADMEVPNFKVNPEKTKSFKKRIEYGFTMQNQRNNSLLPTISDMAISAGYKLNATSLIGVGSSVKVGLGQGFKDFKLSYQGVAIRSFWELKAKGSFWIAGGYELEYFDKLQSPDLLTVSGPWQTSAVLGLSKKYRIAKGKQGNLQLLYDFLAHKKAQNPSPLKFRLGYRF